LREAEALGVLRVTQRGVAGNADFRRPTLFLLTYLPTDDGVPAGDDWRQIETVEQAEAVASKARANKSARYVRLRPKSANPWCRKTPKPVPETGTKKPQFLVPETGTKNAKSLVPQTGTTSRNLANLEEGERQETGESSDGTVVPIGDAAGKLPWSTPQLTEITVTETIRRRI